MSACHDFHFHDRRPNPSVVGELPRSLALRAHFR
jgi:hypothetical protein